MGDNPGLDAWRRASQPRRRWPPVAVAGAALLAAGLAAVVLAGSGGGRPSRAAAPPPGDVVAVGRWTCAAATSAVLRPSTGEVFLVDRWPGPRPVAPAAVVPGAQALRARPASKSGCDELEVVRADAPPVRLRTAVAG